MLEGDTIQRLHKEVGLKLTYGGRINIYSSSLLSIPGMKSPNFQIKIKDTQLNLNC